MIVDGINNGGSTGNEKQTVVGSSLSSSGSMGNSNVPVSLSSDSKPILQKEGSFVLQKENSFVRTGSGRKLPKIPQRSLSASSGITNNACLL